MSFYQYYLIRYWTCTHTHTHTHTAQHACTDRHTHKHLKCHSEFLISQPNFCHHQYIFCLTQLCTEVVNICWWCLVWLEEYCCWLPESGKLNKTTSRDGPITIQCNLVTVQLLCTSTSMNTQKINVLEYEYDYFWIYSSMITLDCNHEGLEMWPLWREKVLNYY